MPKAQEKHFSGFVSDVRKLKSMTFIILNTFEGYRQVTIKDESASLDIKKTLDELTRQSCIEVWGDERDDPTRKGRKEIIPSRISIIAKAETPLPLDPSGKTKADPETQLDWRSLHLREPGIRAIFQLQSKVLQGFQNYFLDNGFLQVFTPSLMGQPSESGSELFTVAYFKKEAFLRQDPQLHRELAIVGGLDRIFEIGPSWRAELSHTTRHLTEHRTCAAEIAYIKDERDIIRLEEEMIASTFKFVKENCKEQLDLFGVDLQVPKTPFPVLEFPGIYDILSEYNKKIPKGSDYDREGEEILSRYVKEKYKSDIYFINKFPFDVKPFYVMREEGTPWARSIDLEYKGVEMSSGGQREHRHDKLLEQIKEKKMDPSKLEWFTKFFRYGAPTMGGFSIGIERLTMQILNLENVRQAVLFPRDTERLVP